MERYDGKTRKDDIKKYTLIGLGVLLVIVGISLLTGFLKQKNTVGPDYQVVVACSESLSQDVVEGLENAIGGVVGDCNGDGTVSVTVQALRLVDLSGNIDLANPGENADDDFNRMAIYLADGAYDLFLLSDEPSGGFLGAATVYCNAGFFTELPENLADPGCSGRASLEGAPFLSEIGLDSIPFYGCVLSGGKAEETNQAIDILRELKTAHVTLW